MPRRLVESALALRVQQAEALRPYELFVLNQESAQSVIFAVSNYTYNVCLDG